MAVAIQDERLEQVDAWMRAVKEQEEAIASSVVQSVRTADTSEGPIMWLPDELVVKVCD
jgi:hypothetical protein